MSAGEKEEDSPSRDFISEMENGKWTLDNSSSEELRILYNTVDNFTRLNSKKYESKKAYEEFGYLLEMHVERIKKYSLLEKEAGAIFFKKVAKIEKEIPKFKKGGIEACRRSLKYINSILEEINTAFII
ncbi:MAG: hypothetical protein H6605_06560 [Flavobacteriales bacterium]|nr:hypothetical protein [Flavobacteriales bacterium]